MRIASVSMIKNECDIIELFFRVNSRFIDRFYVVENGSTDFTLEIINCLIDEGLPISLIRETQSGFLQERLVNRTLAEIRSGEHFDWVVLLDADEFLLGERDELEADLLSLLSDGYGELVWKTFVPVGEYEGSNNPLWSSFRRREFEPVEYVKVVVPIKLVENGRVGAGSHVFHKTDGGSFQAIRVGSGLAHVPIRSSAQIVSKALLGSAALAQKSSRLPGEGFHWDEMANNARRLNYHFDGDQLRQLALNYAAVGELYPVQVVDDLRIGRETDVIRYPDLINVRLVARLDNYIQALISEKKALEAPREVHWLKKFKVRLGL